MRIAFVLKYLVTLLPAASGALLSYLFAWKFATYDPETASPYVSREILLSQSASWLWVGLGLSLTFFLVLLVWDLSSLAGRVQERRALRKDAERSH